MTNREWLESLSDEELANKLKTLSLCERTLDCDACLLGEDGCKNILDWLKAERSEL